VTNKKERQLWFDSYLAEAMAFVPARTSFTEAIAWAWAMAAIAEQFVDGCDEEMAG